MATLVLRREQVAVLADYCRDAFKQRLLRHLREVFPDETEEMPDPLLWKQVQPAMEKAGKYDIQTEYDVVRFVDLTFLLGPDFDSSPEAPWAGEILRDQQLNGAQKTDALWRRVQEDLARAAEMSGKL